MSSSEVRERTRWCPSTASSRPATPPSSGGAEQPGGDQRHQQDGQGAGEGRREAPAETRPGPKQGHAEGDHPFAHRRVDHVLRTLQQDVRLAGGEGIIGVFRPRAFVAGHQIGVGVLDVVGFVKDQGAGFIQPDKAQHACQQCRAQRGSPGPVPGGQGSAQQPQSRSDSSVKALFRWPAPAVRCPGPGRRSGAGSRAQLYSLSRRVEG